MRLPWTLCLASGLLLSLTTATLACPPAPRSRAVLRAFQRLHPCPSTGKTTGACPGYIFDHIQPLACGGKNEIANIQWQTIADARAKDKWERIGCPPCGGNR
jgi:hypothetical protein